MTTLYRILTERRANLARIAGARFDGFTILHGSGYFRGYAEESSIIEILTDNSASQRATVYDLAEDIRRENEQTAVYVTEQSIAVSVFGSA